ncbi:MAG TPA: asparagine synthase (glutamine-hydrolyzing) [Gaiellaceae bacterium]|nr:asparagine synthase (glutamine-hydrolyzing) [Gaiellaceae bacterium]
MCGICGVVQVGGEPRRVLAPGVLDRMTDTMAHRGPDDRGTHEAEGVAFGVRRLSIVDVEGGHQPFASEDRLVWGMQNGELYNHDDLRRQLAARGHRFASRCDTEILPHLYEQEGPSFSEHLRGKFGVAVWDARARRAVLARDRLGVKPLYYAEVGDVVVFGSELKSLLASGLVEPELDLDAVDAFLTFGFMPAPSTPLAGVHKLLPGHRLVIDRTGVRAEQYWAYPVPAPDDPPAPAEEYAAGVLERLEESVRLRLMSDVPLGAMLSGGLDSSLVVALMARNLSEPVKTFSVGFREDREFNELGDAREVAAVFGADHHELELSIDDTVDLADLVWYLDEPLADLSALGFLALSELARQHVTVALSGQGADELFAGYERYRTVAVAGRWAKLPRPLRRVGESIAELGPRRARRAAALLREQDAVTRILRLYDKGPDTLQPNGRSAGAARAVVERIASRVPDDPLPQLLYVDAHLGLVDDMLHYFDRASMAHSLEVRVPFLDHELVEYCARIPPNLKVRGLTTKYVLKQAARGILPDRIVDKRKIGFFNRSLERWLEAQLPRAISEYLLDPGARCTELIGRDTLRRLAEEGIRSPQRATVLLSLLMLEIWLTTYVERARPSRGPTRATAAA